MNINIFMALIVLALTILCIVLIVRLRTKFDDCEECLIVFPFIILIAFLTLSVLSDHLYDKNCEYIELKSSYELIDMQTNPYIQISSGQKGSGVYVYYFNNNKYKTVNIENAEIYTDDGPSRCEYWYTRWGFLTNIDKKIYINNK